MSNMTSRCPECSSVPAISVVDMLESGAIIFGVTCCKCKRQVSSRSVKEAIELWNESAKLEEKLHLQKGDKNDD